MHVIETGLPDVVLLQEKRFADERGWFGEMWSEQQFTAAGLPPRFVQDNQSLSHKGVLRGLHYQVDRPQGKLIRVLRGRIWDVAVDLRPGSPHFGQWAGFYLAEQGDAQLTEMLWIPKGFAHGFLVLSDVAEVLYKVSDLYSPAGERTVRWDDEDLAISWPLDQLAEAALCVSEKDARGVRLKAADLPDVPVNPARGLGA